MPAHLVALPVPRVLHAAHHVPHDVQRIHDGAWLLHRHPEVYVVYIHADVVALSRQRWARIEALEVLGSSQQAALSAWLFLFDLRLFAQSVVLLLFLDLGTEVIQVDEVALIFGEDL